MTAAAALVVLAVCLAPHAVGAWRGVRIGRAAVRSHRDSVRVGARIGRWQLAAVAVLTLVLIGAR